MPCLSLPRGESPVFGPCTLRGHCKHAPCRCHFCPDVAPPSQAHAAGYRWATSTPLRGAQYVRGGSHSLRPSYPSPAAQRSWPPSWPHRGDGSVPMAPRWKPGAVLDGGLFLTPTAEALAATFSLHPRASLGCSCLSPAPLPLSAHHVAHSAVPRSRRLPGPQVRLSSPAATGQPDGSSFTYKAGSSPLSVTSFRSPRQTETPGRALSNLLLPQPRASSSAAAFQPKPGHRAPRRSPGQPSGPFLCLLPRPPCPVTSLPLPPTILSRVLAAQAENWRCLPPHFIVALSCRHRVRCPPCARPSQERLCADVPVAAPAAWAAARGGLSLRGRPGPGLCGEGNGLDPGEMGRGPESHLFQRRHVPSPTSARLDRGLGV